MAKRRPPGDDDSSDDPVKFPFGESIDDSDVGNAADPVKFPFGETGERPGARQFGESLSEIGALDDSDINAFDSSLDIDEVLDSGDLFGSSQELRCPLPCGYRSKTGRLQP